MGAYVKYRTKLHLGDPRHCQFGAYVKYRRAREAGGLKCVKKPVFLKMTFKTYRFLPLGEPPGIGAHVKYSTKFNFGDPQASRPI